MAPLPQHDVAVSSEAAEHENPSNNDEASSNSSRKKLEDLGYGVESFHTIIQPGKEKHMWGVGRWIVSNKIETRISSITLL